MPERISNRSSAALIRSEATFDDRLDVQFNIRQAERINSADDLFEIRSGIDQRRQSHVATDTAHAVEISNPHDEILLTKIRGPIEEAADSSGAVQSDQWECQS